jgi:charged multivesicular body protein 1
MGTFKKQFEETDVQAGGVDIATTQTPITTVSQKQVDNLMSQTAEEAGLELKLVLPQVQVSTLSEPLHNHPLTSELTERLTLLCNK